MFVPGAAENSLPTRAAWSLERILPTVSARQNGTPLNMGQVKKPQASVDPQNITNVASAESKITFSSGKSVMSNYSIE